ncbi:Trimethylamine-N-oxide reductase [Mannheimia haemolytica]|uniref:trimethylamine-N-oxide reductase TorA n=1 Tax=Mannheimia haemolytica TaxID=75985 RepID=UPI0003869276|nr:trimethylamine-N-oxide reductase TorA [Mannheimia haemolytica]EPY99754.1 trimethylamine N-oxide reductase I catalytic subunit [Mannheimia haemolytica D35]KYL18881.1 trimethylamine N-oxide reductase I catalytic subunit [Mannheimia haemolytica]KYL24514.1 trimethylamine N-oxide reductase I catalytic subunit [Mannheimia haemolytica]MDW0573568.1 trimethylamine-N-oxide reductase TorA [Mannheimia haemolytica]MDW0778132.1 trimethylamine-N-oxide reductase TorA [Mannheimia haemolytica]
MQQSRRQFLKNMSVMAAAVTMPNFLVPRNVFASEDLSQWKVSGSHWGAMRAKIENGRVAEIKPFEFDKHPTEMLNGIKGLIYSDSRIRYPMVRLDWLKNRHNSNTAQRGDNRFVRVTWDEALDLFYQELERVQKEYGPWALHTANVGWRSTGQFHSCGNHMIRAIAMHGNSVGTAGDYSTGAGQTILPYVLGSTEVYSQGTSWEIILKESENIIFWASDPVKNLQVGWNCETHEAYAYLEKLKEKVAAKGVNVICVDPVKSKTHNFLGCEQQYINPQTDVPFMLALAHTLYTENLYDKKFLDMYTVGFEKFLPYLLGETEDKVAKTPEWAAEICGISADKIREFARMLAGKRTQFIFGWAIQRQQHGEQPYWMGAVLASMLGQIGLAGGGISYAHHYSSIGIPESGAAMPGAFPLNIDEGQTPKYDNKDYKGYSDTIPVARMTDSLLHAGETIDYNGKKVTYAPFKMAIFTGCNQWHRHSERNKMKQAFQKLETIVSINYSWTATCRFSDIVLPACTPFERNDIDAYGSYSNRGVIAMHKLVDPLYDSRSDFEIFRDLCRRFGKEKEYSRGMDEMQWVEKLYKDCRRENKGKFEMPEFAEFWQKGYVLFPEGKPWVRHADFREDPELHALGTPSGFIEIYSNKIASFGYDDCKGHPMWFEKAERSHGGKNSDKFPYWLQSVHPDKRLHSQLCESKELRETYSVQGREPLYINPQDAAKHGIQDGDLVRVFNDRGQAIVGAVLSDNFPTGVVRLQEGAWYSPLDESVGAIDTYGDPNTMTLDIGTSKLAQAVSANTCLVNIEKFVGNAPAPNGFNGAIEVTA